MNCQEFEELSGAYALEALTGKERQQAEEHLAQCPNCPIGYRDLQGVINLLPLAAPFVKPSPLLGKRILAHIQASEAYQPGSERRSYPTRKARRNVPWASQLLAVAAVLLLVLSGGLTAWNIELQQQIAGLTAHQATPPIIYALQGTKVFPQVTGQVIYFPQQHLTSLVLHGLPTPLGTHVYQGWLVNNKTPNSIGLLNLQNNTDNNTATLTFPGDIKDYDTAAISLEPGPHASHTAPQGKVIAAGSLKGTPTAVGNTSVPMLSLLLQSGMFVRKSSSDSNSFVPIITVPR